MQGMSWVSIEELNKPSQKPLIRIGKADREVRFDTQEVHHKIHFVVISTGERRHLLVTIPLDDIYHINVIHRDMIDTLRQTYKIVS